MTSDTKGPLIALGDTDQTSIDPAQDIRGRKVRDSDDRYIGTVEDLLVDPAERAVRFLRVKHGRIFGFGVNPSLIPVETVTRAEAGEVHIGRSSAKVGEAPRYDPELSSRPHAQQHGYYDRLYSYYGISSGRAVETDRAE